MESSAHSTVRGSPPDPSTVTEPSPVRCHLWLSGRVQGVGFRFFTERVARRLGLSGFARNLADGRVEVVAEGARSAVETLLKELRQGPSGAVVHNVIVEWEPPTGKSGFWIR